MPAMGGGYCPLDITVPCLQPCSLPSCAPSCAPCCLVIARYAFFYSVAIQRIGSLDAVCIHNHSGTMTMCALQRALRMQQLYTKVDREGNGSVRQQQNLTSCCRKRLAHTIGSIAVALNMIFILYERQKAMVTRAKPIKFAIFVRYACLYCPLGQALHPLSLICRFTIWCI